MSEVINGFQRVFFREIHRMTQRRFYLIASLVLPLFAVCFMGSIFGNGRMEPLSVGWVDLDDSSTSRQIRSLLEALPSLQVTNVYANEQEAREGLQRAEVYGYLVVPFGYELYAHTDAPKALRGYYHTAFLSVGGEVKRAFASLMQPVAVSPVVSTARALGMYEYVLASFLQPVVEQVHPLFNPLLNYRLYLSYPFCFILLQVLLLLLTTYALGSERKEGTVCEWLAAAHGRMGVAVMGKLVPMFLLFSLVSLCAHLLFFGFLRFPTEAPVGQLWFASLLFFAATQAVACCFYAVLPALSLVFSGVSMFGSLGATLSGVTFPLMSMPKPVSWLAELFPIRHFVQLSRALMSEGVSFSENAFSWMALLLFLLPPFFLFPRLKRILLSHRYEHLE